MNASKYRYILYLIATVIICTIGIQVYWNFINYKNSKQQLINDVQISLDNAVNRYYENLAQETTYGFAIQADSHEDLFSKKGSLDSLIKLIDSSHQNHIDFKILDSNAISGINVIKAVSRDSIFQELRLTHHDSSNRAVIAKQWSSKPETNPLLNQDIKILTSKVILSITNDSLNLKKVDSLVKLELKRKHVSVDFYLDYNTSFNNTKTQNDWSNKLFRTKDYLTTSSQSSFLPPDYSLTIAFTNSTKAILTRMLGGILISTLLVLAVISCLFYLLKIIKHQKQLSEVKNDLISNITHEFKTPIATIGVALESIQSFNTIDDKEKTKTYLDMSNQQLSKLNTMVEKLLETATLDSENLELNKDRYHISEVVISIIEKHKLQNSKSVNYDIEDNVFANVDIFHFENAVNNIIDNAYKYGGEDIEVSLHGKSTHIELVISDNGISLSKANKDRVFEKFYRVPKGNTHDVKGFGIGLYYTKKIIEKHQGNIQLSIDNKNTSFKITLPYA